jgi:hypothetical protein
MSPNNRLPLSKWKADFLLFAFVIALWASSLLGNVYDPPLPLIMFLFVCGGILFILAAPVPNSWPDLPEKDERSKWQNLTIGLSIIFSVVSFIIFWFGKNNPEQYSGLPLFLWVLSLILFLVSIICSGKSIPSEGKKNNKIEILFLLLIVLGSFFLRTYKLNVFPNGCQSDECNNGLDAIKWLQGQPYTPYIGTNEGQATLFSYLLALSFKLLGVGVFQMRIVSAVIGSLTLVAFYFLARDFLKWQFALTTTTLFGVARWHLTFSRIIYELILTPLAEILVFIFFIRAIKNGDKKNWAFTGLCLAFGMNTYTGFRIIPVLIAVYLIYWILTHRDRIGRDVRGILYLGLGVWTGLVPLSVYIFQNWQTFMSRTAHISIIKDISNAGGSLQPLWDNVYRTIWSFQWKGDWAAINNLPGEPLLDLLMGILFLFGFAYTIRYIRQPQGFLYFIWIIAGLSLAIFSTVNEAPTARRTIGLLPVIFLVSGTVLQLTWETLRGFIQPLLSARYKNPDRPIQIIEGLFLGLVVMVVAATNINKYFNFQAKDPSVWRAYSSTEAAIGEYLLNLPANNQVYLDPGYAYHSAIIFISKSRPYTTLNLAKDLPILDIPNPPKDIIYILASYYSQLELILKRIYPQGTWEVHKDPFGEPMFYTFWVSANTLEQANGIMGEYYPGDEILDKPVLSRQDSSLHFQWGSLNKSPLPAPFSAKWSGSIYFPDGYGTYSFEIITDGIAEFIIDGRSVLKTPENGRQLPSASLSFVGGFHTFTFTYHSGSHPKELSLLWKSTKPDFVTIPRSVFFSADLALNGLTGYYYPNEEMTGPPSLIQNDFFVIPNNVLPEPFSIIWKGKIEIPKSGEYIFGTIADDGSYVYIDHRLVVDNGGSHGAENRQGIATLDQGFHDLEIRYWQIGGSREMQFWWQPSGGIRENVPMTFLFPEEGQGSINMNVVP